MNPLRLGEQLRRVVFSQEQVVDRGCDFYPQPLGEFLVLNTEILYGLFFLDFLK